MLRIALTGNIATGKSTVLGFFSGFGFETIDSDRIVAALYKDKKAKNFLLENFGTTEKKFIAKKIFESPKLRAKLESFLHPLVFKEIDAKTRKLEKSGKKIVVAEIPLLFETGAEKNFGKTIVVKATQAQQVYRLQKHSGFSAEEAFARIKSQAPLEKKIKKADFVIDNTGSLAETKKQVKKIKKILENFMPACAKKAKPKR